MIKRATADQRTQLEFYAPSCKKCDSTEVRRLERKIFDEVFSFQRFQCSRCKHRQRQFRLVWSVLPKALLALVLLGTPVYLARYPAIYSSSAVAATVGEADRLARARTAAGGQVSTFEQMMTRKPKATLDNSEILRLWRANVGTSVILQMIRTSNGAYDVTTNAVIALKEAQVDQSIILAIIDANYNAR
jgi:hypothetical protein